MRYFITGCAGFIGFHVAKKIIENGHSVVGVDNLNSYYDKNLKLNRLAILKKINRGKFVFLKGDISNYSLIKKIFSRNYFEKVIHLAAQAGVRYSISNPRIYIKSNLVGFANILINSQINKTKHFIYASSSSVYGDNKSYPFSESHQINKPKQFYAATKISNEVMAYSYSYLYSMPTTGLRFFTVYGPWGRPDMAPMIFTKKILNNENINLFNKGKDLRDFTYIDDVVASTLLVVNQKIINNSFVRVNKQGALKKNSIPYQIFNIGNASPVSVNNFINLLEIKLKKKAKLIYLPEYRSDMKKTFASTIKFKKHFSFKTKTSLSKGINNFLSWYKKYYYINK